VGVTLKTQLQIQGTTWLYPFPQVIKNIFFKLQAQQRVNSDFPAPFQNQKLMQKQQNLMASASELELWPIWPGMLQFSTAPGEPGSRLLPEGHPTSQPF